MFAGSCYDHSFQLWKVTSVLGLMHVVPSTLYQLQLEVMLVFTLTLERCMMRYGIWAERSRFRGSFLLSKVRTTGSRVVSRRLKALGACTK